MGKKKCKNLQEQKWKYLPLTWQHKDAVSWMVESQAQ